MTSDRSFSTAPTPCELVAFMAHPDDAELQCGGTLAVAAEHGWRAGVVDFTRGELATRGTPEEREVEASLAARELGLSCRVNLGFRDGHLEDNGETRKRVVELLRQMRPRVVIAPPREDHHADHVAVATTLERSVYLAGVEKYAPCGHEPWRPHALLHAVGSRPAVPHLVVDISRVIETRRRAIACYRSQFFRPGATERTTRISHPDFNEWIEGALRRFGFLIGAAYGEAFTSEMPVPVTDPVAQYTKAPWADVKEDA